MKFLLPIFLIVFIGSAIYPSHVLADFIHTSGTKGYDISYPQCDSDYPLQPFDFNIIGVNRGKAFTQNECLQNEFNWSKNLSQKTDLYINLNFPSEETITYGLNGPDGHCIPKNMSCQAYNYGYNAAKYAYKYALSQQATSETWWIDIETENTWSDTFTLNNQVIQGAIDFLSVYNIQTGIYSTDYQWTTIMGKEYIPSQRLTSTIPLNIDIKSIPNWLAGGSEDDLSYCEKSFTVNSQVWMVQYANGEFDGNFACL